MKIIQLVQRSPEWHRFRQKHVMASDIGSICGVNPYRSAYQIWLDKIGAGKPVEMNANIQRGIELEPVARKLLGEHIGVEFTEIVVESSEYPWLGASLDGYFVESEYIGDREYQERRRFICELKAGGERAHELAKKGEIPSYYRFQCQQALICTQAEVCFFANYRPEDTKTPLVIIEEKPCSVIQKAILFESEFFWKTHVLGYMPPLKQQGD